MNSVVRLKRKNLTGLVVSDKMNKTRVVVVQRTVRDTFYEKIRRKKNRFYVHDEGNESHSGDLVEIISTRPLSTLKRWRISRILKKA